MSEQNYIRVELANELIEYIDSLPVANFNNLNQLKNEQKPFIGYQTKIADGLCSFCNDYIWSHNVRIYSPQHKNYAQLNLVEDHECTFLTNSRPLSSERYKVSIDVLLERIMNTSIKMGQIS